MLSFRLDRLKKYIETNHRIPWVMANSCCRIELENVAASTYDWRRLGIQDNAHCAEDADLLIIAGWINPAMAEEIKKEYAKLGPRKSVIAVGACALSGSPFANPNDKLILASDVLPVDVFVPGCPPKPESILNAILMLRKKLSPNLDQKAVLYEALKEYR